MKGWLSSPRFRRRLLWVGGSVCALAAIVSIAVVLGNTGRSNATAIDKTKKPWVYSAPAHMRQGSTVM